MELLLGRCSKYNNWQFHGLSVCTFARVDSRVVLTVIVGSLTCWKRQNLAYYSVYMFIDVVMQSTN